MLSSTACKRVSRRPASVTQGRLLRSAAVPVLPPAWAFSHTSRNHPLSLLTAEIGQQPRAGAQLDANRATCTRALAHLRQSLRRVVMLAYRSLRALARYLQTSQPWATERASATVQQCPRRASTGPGQSVHPSCIAPVPCDSEPGQTTWTRCHRLLATRAKARATGLAIPATEAWMRAQRTALTPVSSGVGRVRFRGAPPAIYICQKSV